MTGLYFIGDENFKVCFSTGHVDQVMVNKIKS